MDMCKRGHELTDDNKYIRKRRGHIEVECRLCRKERAANYTYIGDGQKILINTLKSHHGEGMRKIKYPEYYQEWRLKVITALGGKCVKCNFDVIYALQIDHKNGGGLKQYDSISRGTPFYRYVLAHLDDYQCLCANCNWVKRHENNENRG